MDTSERPADPGSGNLNLQLTSTRAGTETARDLGAEYVLKARSDQRLYAPQSLPFLHSLLDDVAALPHGSPRQALERRALEFHLGLSYLERIGWPVQGTIADWWRLLAERFVVVDAASPYRTVQFADWLPWARDASLAGIDVPEHMLDA